MLSLSYADNTVDEWCCREGSAGVKLPLMILLAGGACLNFGLSLAIADSPPKVSILTYPEMYDAEYLPIFLGESISLIAEVQGNGPMSYRWLSDGDSVGTGPLLQDYIYSETGDYKIRLEATDGLGETGRDTCFVSVVRLATESDLWGAIKSTYR